MPNEKLPKIDKVWSERQFGIVCDQCGSTMWFVTNTIRRDNRIIRYRECRVCRYRVSTVEKADS
jgi:hypothetical protein